MAKKYNATVKAYHDEVDEQIEIMRTQINQARDILIDKYWDEIKNEPSPRG